MTDPDEFGQLFEDTARMVYNLGLRLFRNEEDALDFSQDVYLQAYRKLDTFEGRARFSTWLYSLALNLGLKKIQKEKRLRLMTQEEAALERYVEEEIGDDRGDPFEQTAEAEVRQLVQDELAKLPDVYRLPLLLFYFEHMQYSEIAEKLGLKEGTLKSYIHRGKRILIGRLREIGLQP